jgi:hypothetical protein
MTIDVLVLNSGEWTLREELPAAPWHVLIYRQRGEPRNELHLWLPRHDARRTAELAFRRYWVDGGVRWCVEAPGDPDRPRLPARAADGSLRLRFTCSDGRVLWADHHGPRGLGDLTEYQLGRLIDGAAAGPFVRS